LLRENTKRFVLFPIQYSEVCLVLKWYFAYLTFGS
jgi:hypothetical protein